jgi:hypothetical protein
MLLFFVLLDYDFKREKNEYLNAAWLEYVIVNWDEK